MAPSRSHAYQDESPLILNLGNGAGQCVATLAVAIWSIVDRMEEKKRCSSFDIALPVLDATFNGTHPVLVCTKVRRA
jgi:hypothetical protein